MKIKLWRILLFLLIIIGATVLVFPSKHRITSLFIESGIVDKAQYYISALLQENSEDIKLRVLTSDLYQVEGESSLAIKELERAIKKDPKNIKLLARLAILYEWSRNSKKALKTWERVAEINPNDMKVLSRLIDYYRYFKFSKKESAAIAKLILLEKESAEEKTPKRLLISMLDSELYDLARKRMNVKDDPNLDTLLSGLYLIRKLYQDELDKTGKESITYKKETIDRTLELFIMTGEKERAIALASYLDQKENLDIQTRLQLTEIMRWAGADQYAISLLMELHRKYPNNNNIILKLATIGEEIGDLESAIFAYEKLTINEPEMEDYKYHLVSLYLSADKPKNAYFLLRDLVKSTKNLKYLSKMLTVVGYTDNIELQSEAIGITEKFKLTDPYIIRKLANLYLAVNDSKNANLLFLKLSHITKGNKTDVLNMLKSAEYTEDKELIETTISEALRLLPEDPDILSNAAEMYMALDLTEKAYLTYRRLTEITGRSKKLILKMLKAAGYSSRKDYIKEALTISLAAWPDDYEIVRQAGEMYLWLDMPEKAYEVYKKMAIWSGGKQQGIWHMINVADSTDQPGVIKEALFLARRLRPEDIDIRLRLADFFLSQGDEINAISAYKDYLKLNPTDEQAQMKLAQLYMWTDHPEKASKILETLSEQDRNNFDKALAAGNAFIDAKKLKKGIAFLERALQIKPESTFARRKLADSYEWAGLTEKMIAELEHLDSIGLLDNKDRILLARSYVDQNKGAKALELLKPFERAKKLPREEGIMLAISYEHTGRNTDSTRIFNRLHKENSEDTEFLAKLGNNALWSRRTDLALQYFEDVLKKEPENLTALKGGAEAYAINNNIENAIKNFKAYNKLNPNDYEARYQLAEIYFNNGREEEAFKQYKKAQKLINNLKATQ